MPKTRSLLDAEGLAACSHLCDRLAWYGASRTPLPTPWRRRSADHGELVDPLSFDQARIQGRGIAIVSGRPVNQQVVLTVDQRVGCVPTDGSA
jgi:hypothetical protein